MWFLDVYIEAAVAVIKCHYPAVSYWNRNVLGELRIVDGYLLVLSSDVKILN